MSNGTVPRRSIFGGLLLIFIGTVFLLHYMRPGLIDMGRMARYWPVLLIVWGLAKLFDHSAQRANQAPPRTMSGGEFALLVLLLCLGTAFFVLERIHREHPGFDVNIDLWDQPYSYSNELPPQAVAPNSLITVTVPRGNLTIHPEETPEIRVTVIKSVRASSQHEADRIAEKARVTIEKAGTGYEVRGEVPEDASRADLNLEVHVPKQASITAKTEHGNIQISDLSGAVNAATGSGEVEIHNIGGEVIADVRHGDARITGVHADVRLTGSGGEVELADVSGTASVNGEFYGPIRLRNVNKTIQFISKRTELTVGGLPGRLEIDADSLGIYDTPANISLTTRNRDIHIDNVSGRIQIGNRHGDIEVRFAQPPRDEVNISNESGSVELALPDKSTWTIAAQSHSGEVESEFQAPTLKLTQGSDNSRFEGKLGNGPQINITTSYGTIRIRKVG